MKEWFRAYWSNDSTPVLLLVITAVLLITVLFYVPLGHDQAWMLHEAQLLLQGGRPHQPIASPFIVNTLIHIPPVYLSHWFGWHILFAFKVYSIVMLLGVLWIYYLQIRLLSGSHRTTIWFLLALLPFVFPPMIDFAQRDHWVACCLLVYVFTVVARRAGQDIGVGLAAISGALAAIAVLLKPHYALVLLAVELYLLGWHRSISKVSRPETIVILICGAVYVAGTAITMPDAFRRELPMLTGFYWTYSAPWSERIQAGHIAIWLLLLASLRIRLPENLTGLRWLVLSAIAAAYTAFLLLGNTWLYRQLPFLGLAWAYGLAGFFYWHTLKPDVTEKPAAAASKAALLCNLLLFLLLAITFLSSHRVHKDFTAWLHGGKMQCITNMVSVSQIEQAFAGLPPVKSIFVMDTQLFPYVLFMMQNGLEWPSRYHSMWLLPAWAKIQAGEVVVTGQKKAEMAAVIDRFHGFIAEDLLVQQPDVIVVDISATKSIFDTTRFDYIEYFKEHVPYFRKIWPQYRHVKNIYLANQDKVAKGKVKQWEVAIYIRSDLLPNDKKP